MTQTATRCPRCLTGVLFLEPPSVFDNGDEWACISCGNRVYSDQPEDSEPHPRPAIDRRGRIPHAKRGGRVRSQR